MQLQCHLPLAGSFRQEYLAYYGVLPLEFVDERLRVAIVGDPDPDVLEDLGRTYGRELELLAVERGELEEAIRRTFASAESMVELVNDLEGSVGGPAPADADSAADTRDLANQPPVIRFVNLLIRDAHESGASDIHLEETRDGLRLRLRIDGVLSDLPAPPRPMQAAVVSRVKLLADLDIAERRVPQDGRIRVRLESRELDIRVATSPTLHGESVVLRLLDRGGRPVGLGELGMDAGTLAQVTTLAARAHGMMLVTGPTGSGKTTTLYAALGLRRTSEEKIITVEDPVEYYLEGVTQVPINPKAAVTFATALRALLRQDPDVLMVGEMRDTETAAIATQAALTGHLVLSTLHTNDAVSAVDRLIDLRVEPYLVAATVEAVLAQRLVRRTCPECRVRYTPDPAAVSLLSGKPVGGISLERGSGCGACRQTGYRGRTGIFELFLVSDVVKDQIVHGAHGGTLRQWAMENGMQTLKEDAWSKVQTGITTVEEVFRVLGQ